MNYRARIPDWVTPAIPAPPLPAGVTTGRHGFDVIFYDPLSAVSGGQRWDGRLSSARGGSDSPRKQRNVGATRPGRISALKAVEGELAILLLRKRNEESCSRLTTKVKP